jgi:oligoendopeptidase F
VTVPPEWDLATLMPDGAVGASAAGREAVAHAQRFADAHRGRVAGYDAAALSALCGELEQVQEALTSAYAYAMLRFDADTDPPEHGALLTEAEDVMARVETLVTFFELEWLAVDDPRADELLADPALERFAHWLCTLRLSRPHRLSEPEERLLAEKAITGRGSWRRLLDEQVATLIVAMDDGTPVTLTEALTLLSADDRAARRGAAEAITAGLRRDLRTRASIFNVLLYDHAVDDRLRRFPHWLAELNLENEASDASVQALVDAVVARYDIPQRWCRLKARALGLARLADYDRFAPVGARSGAGGPVSWVQARDLVLSSYAGFSPRLGREARRFFDERWIDAAPREGKIQGAYCAATIPSAHPYVLLNFSGQLEDVLILAHELGHGLHFLLAAGRGVLAQETPVTVAETASVFGETLVFAHLLDHAGDAGLRFSLLARQLDEAVATVFRQIAIHRFEDAVHRERRERGELSVARLGEHWLSVNGELYGDSLELSDGYETWWSYVSHVFNSPGYVYAYAYGQLLALSLYAQYRERGGSFVDSYLELLAAGGSRSPQQLGEIVGVDLSDPGFWATGLELIDRTLDEAQEMTAAMAS